MHILSISGAIKMGKSLAASLVCEIDPRFEIISFADPLKDMYAKKKGIDRSILSDIVEKEKHRKGMVDFGDVERAKDPYVFAIALINRLNPAGYYVCDDTRRLEELEVLLKQGAKAYGIYSDAHSRAIRGWKPNPEVDNHPSEMELGHLSSYTWHCLGGGLFYNTKSKDYLKEQVFTVVRKCFPYVISDLPLLGKVK